MDEYVERVLADYDRHISERREEILASRQVRYLDNMAKAMDVSESMAEAIQRGSAAAFRVCVTKEGLTVTPISAEDFYAAPAPSEGE